MTQRLVGVPANMINVLQGIIILVIVATKMILADPYLAERVWRTWNKRFKKPLEVEA
jgi:simple sugar transport system permease protein